MSNPFIPDLFPPEPIEEIPEGSSNCAMFVKDFIRREELQEHQADWFLSQMEKHIPLYVLYLWQGFPEWEITIRALDTHKVCFQVGTEPGAPRYLSFIMNGVRLAETKI